MPTALDDPYRVGTRIRSWALPLTAIGVAGSLAGTGAMLALSAGSGFRSAVRQVETLGSTTSVIVVWVGVIITWIAANMDSRAFAAGHRPGPAPDQPTRARRVLQNEYSTWLPIAVILGAAAVPAVIYLGYDVTLAVIAAIVCGLWGWVRRLRHRLGVVMNRGFLPRLRG